MNRVPRWIQLGAKQLTPFGFGGFTDGSGHLGEAGQTAQEPTIGGRSPTHIPRPTPAVGPQRIQAAVIANPVVGVALESFTTEIAEFGPHHTHRRMPLGEVLCRSEAILRCKFGESSKTLCEFQGWFG